MQEISSLKKRYIHIILNNPDDDTKRSRIMNLQKLCQKVVKYLAFFGSSVPGKVEVDIQLLVQLQEQLITSANAIAAQLEEPEARLNDSASHADLQWLKVIMDFDCGMY